MRSFPFLALAFSAMFSACAQQSGPALSIDAAANQHVISPDIYGINYFWDVGSATGSQLQATIAAGAEMRATVRRWGGNGTSTYHWKFDVSNIDADWFYEVLPDTTIDASKLPVGSSFNTFADQVRTTGGKILGTIPVLGWLPKERREMCSFDVAKYGKQCKQDPYAQYHPYTCGNGVVYDSACGDPSVNDGKSPSHPVYITNDPTDAYAQFDQAFQAQWIQYLLTRYGQGNQGGITIWSLDNEPIWWDSTHRDIHPNPYTYDELLSLDTTYAQAIKQADPTALVSGPVGDNWASLWFSKKDIVAGQARGNYWSNPVDRNAHGGMALLPWYLSQMAAYEQQNGVRLLDYLDQHAYLAPSNVAFSPAGSAATQALRLQSTRVFWDPSYIVTGDYWIRDTDKNGAPVAPQFIPRLRSMVDQYYPGTKVSLTEYNWGALDDINGALAQADLLGIFGREGLDLATLWGPPKPTDPGAFAFKIFRNYDGIGGAFGDTSVQASSADQAQLAVYAALRSDAALTAVVVNKTGNDLSSTLSLANYDADSAAHVWQYSAAKLDSIVAQPDITVADGVISAVFPANSITLIVVPPASLAVPAPAVASVANAASYSTAVAPGQMVVVWGSDMGPEQIVSQQMDPNGMVSTSLAWVRILFDGVPAPLVYVSANQASAVVPYFGATKATTHVQVEYQGVRSDPLEIPVSPTAPGLFTADASGQGQGVIFNEDGITPNSPSSPASPGSLVILSGTGEGVTDPPGVDGRPAIDVLPTPLAQVSVQIGGLPAKVEYAGAAPGSIPGLFQIKARISQDVTPDDNVPIQVTIGGITSQSGVTVAVH
ncbi:MAG TPA: glycoside hydrolase family 44 protein [Bryobacteraceae bacterium]|nr:glycoside hydrolase family 44 protein [Bryobacteraceae bacterium]